MVPSEVINNLGRVCSSMRRGIVKFRTFLEKEKIKLRSSILSCMSYTVLMSPDLVIVAAKAQVPSSCPLTPNNFGGKLAYYCQETGTFITYVEYMHVFRSHLKQIWDLSCNDKVNFLWQQKHLKNLQGMRKGSASNLRMALREETLQNDSSDLKGSQRISFRYLT